MVKSIEEYTAEISKSYDNSRNALQNQINAIEGDLNAAKSQIEERYNKQQSKLDQQRQWAASAASLRSAANGTSYGGAANVANKKYYEQTFVPAQESLTSDRNTSLDSADRQANANRLSLQQQLASMNDEISRMGIQRYYDELEREREEAYRQQQLELERQRIAASRSGGYGGYGGGGGGSQPVAGKGYMFGLDDGDGYYFKDGNGNWLNAQEYANLSGQNIVDVLRRMGNDFNATRALAGLNNANHQLTREEEIAFDTLGIDRTGWGRRA